MIDSPIKRKQTHYPRDFAPVRAPKTPQPLRYTLNAKQHSQISQQHRLTEVEQEKTKPQQAGKVSSPPINPEKLGMNGKQLQQEDPLAQHNGPRPHNLDAQLLRKPRFSIKDGEEIPQEQHETIPSPIGIIRHQQGSKQAPLPLEDTCRIDLLQRNRHRHVPDSVILFKSSSNVEGRKWVSSEKEVIESFRESRMRRSSVKELPVVSKTHIADQNNHAYAHEVYNSFRMRQMKSHQASMGQVNNLLLSLKEKQQPVNNALPRFKPNSTVERLRDEVNYISRHSHKKQANGYQQQGQTYQQHQWQEQQQVEQRQPVQYVKPKKHKKVKGPQFVVSYRSSLAQLKDIHSRIKHLQDYKITVKVPKLFTEELLTREQDRSELYETAETIFSQLRLPHDNIVVKRYTNCVTATCRNIGLIWSFEGRRYLGGWQSEYLDEGFKHGVGLEWQPRKYVYYGEFARNRREGLGVLKDSSEEVTVGYWKKGRMVEVESESEGSQSGNEEGVMYD